MYASVILNDRRDPAREVLRRIVVRFIDDSVNA